jgi:hypothetical protein
VLISPATFWYVLAVDTSFPLPILSPIPKQVLIIDHQEAAVLESDRTHMTSLGSILTRIELKSRYA